jgi:hypothetical protein
MKNLSLLKETSDKELQGIAEIVGKFINSTNAQDDILMLQAITKINANSGLLSFFFPNELGKEQQKMTLEIMRKMHTSRLQLLEIYTNLKIEIAKKSADAMLAAVGMDLQAKLTEFANQKINDMSESFAKSRSDFMKRIARQEMELEQYKNSLLLYEPALESLRNEVKIYFKSIDELLDGFIKALRKKLPTN